jgi:hypothetical protein
LQIEAMLLLLALSAGSAMAEVVGDLFGTETIVTGTGGPERSRGVREAFAQLLAKLTGDVRSSKEPALADLFDDPQEFVESVEYEDRMKGIPIHDEQGTRERSYYLRVRFKPDRVTTALTERGVKLWPADRPLVAVWFAVRTPAGSYVLQPQGSAGYGQRLVLQEEARRRAIPIAIAPQRSGSAAVTPDEIDSTAVTEIQKATARGDALLIGMLDLGEAGAWNMRWLLTWKSKLTRWQMDHVTFDTAIKEGLQRAAFVLAGRS